MQDEPSAPPLGELRYLYVGTRAFEEDRAYYRDVVGAEEIWHFEEFRAPEEARMAGRLGTFEIPDGPCYLEIAAGMRWPSSATCAPPR
jgi:hypothetical protein